MITIITIRIVHDKPGMINHAFVELRRLLQNVFGTLDVNVWEEKA